MAEGYEVWSPVDVERRLIELITAITLAQKDLAGRRNQEVQRESLHRQAVTRVSHDPNCPVVRRGETTVAEREEWISERTQSEWQHWAFARTERDIAVDNMRALQTQASLVQTLASSVRQAYSVSGG